MFLQIHMLQSMPPGNLNRDDSGQPKKCIFGGVTRGRISSQCLKRNIRHSMQFKEVFGDDLSVRTKYLPKMVADELRKLNAGFYDDDLSDIKFALAKNFKGEKKKGDSDEEEESGRDQEMSKSSSPSDISDQTGQLVFFPPHFAIEIAKLIEGLRKEDEIVYESWISGKKKGKTKDKEEEKENKRIEKRIEKLEKAISDLSKAITVDIGMFGRMTTSELVVNVEASCQVAHAISTHETLIESDYFTAMDDKQHEFAPNETGAAFLGSGDTETFFNSAVYYKYLNLDIDALKKHLSSWDDKLVANAAGALVSAAAHANPTGKQNSFAAHGIPELILVEVSKVKRPISYANAFLKPVDGLDLMAESSKALTNYIAAVASAFAPPDMRRVLLAVGSASTIIADSAPPTTATLDSLIESVRKIIEGDDA